MRLPLALLEAIRKVNFLVVHWPEKIRLRPVCPAAPHEF
jgi:hypothetical protein